MTAPVRHDAAARRFESGGGPELAVCSYHLDGRVMVLSHTAVPAALQGQGLAAVLVQAALDWARAQGLQVEPRCSYVASYMQRHPQTQDLLAR